MDEFDYIDAKGVCLTADGQGTILAEASPLGRTGTGYGFREDTLHPFPKLYNQSTKAEQGIRNDELARARLENIYNETLLPGAVVHGNIGSKDVKENIWTLRGTEEQRKRAREDNRNSDDSDPGEDGVDIYESMWHYYEKNCDLWAKNSNAEAKLSHLLAMLTNNLIDNENPEMFRLNVVDPILAFAPAGRPTKVAHLDFYPEGFDSRYPKQPFDEDYSNDDVIAWVQTAYGSPHFRLQPYKSHLPNFKVTDEMFRRTNDFKNDNLDLAMAEGRVFVVNFDDMHEFNVRAPASQSRGARFYAPIGMFAVPRNSGDLKVIAIQSTQNAPKNEAERNAWKADNTQDPLRPLSDIMTPTDDFWSWQMTKALFMSMYGMSNVIDHLSTHVFLGPIPIGFYRNIPEAHPLTALLDPHLHSLNRNNHLGIFWDSGTQDSDSYGPPDKGLLTGMMNKLSGWTGQTFIDATVRQAGTYDFVRNSTPIDRSKPNDFSAISDFPVLDDNGNLPIIERWVRNYLKLYYRSDADVRSDQELQSFCSETVRFGKVAGFPDTVSSVDELVDLCARIIYWMSVNHALEATLGCTKFAPLSYWSDHVPRNDEVKTEKDWLNIMPPINIGLAIFCASRFFVDLPREWYRSLGRFPEGHFLHDQRVYPHLARFQKELLELDNRIQVKNAERRWGYTMMRPATMTCSPWN